MTALFILLLLILFTLTGTGLVLVVRHRQGTDRELKALEALLPRLQSNTIAWSSCYREGINLLEEGLEEAEALVSRAPDSLAALRITQGWPEKKLLPLADLYGRILPRWKELAKIEQHPLRIAAQGAEQLASPARGAQLLSEAARVYLNQGHLDEALELLRRAENLFHPPGRQTLSLLARVYHLQGKTEEAGELIEHRLEPSLAKITVLCRLASQNHDDGNREAAETQWQQALKELALIREKKEQQEALRCLTESLLEKGETEKVEAFLRSLKPHHSLPGELKDHLWFHLALKYGEQHRQDQAQRASEQIGSPGIKALVLLGQSEEDPEKAIPAMGRDSRQLLKAASILRQYRESPPVRPFLEQALKTIRQSQTAEEETFSLWLDLHGEAQAAGETALAEIALREAWAQAEGKLRNWAALPWEELSSQRKEYLCRIVDHWQGEKSSPALAHQLIRRLISIHRENTAFSLLSRREGKETTIQLLITAASALYQREGSEFEGIDPARNPEAALALHKLLLNLDL